MAAHRRARQRSLGGRTARGAATLALAGAATATAFDGTGHAEPRLTPAQVKAKVDKLYHEAEIATEKYNGAKEQADAARKAYADLQDEAARKTEKLNTARDALSSVATAQYRTGALDPSVQLALSADPDEYLEGAALAERIGDRQAHAVTGVGRDLAEIGRLRAEAAGERTRLAARQAQLRAHKRAVTDKLDQAERLLDQLTAPQRTEVTAAPHASRADSRSAPAPAPSLAATSPNSRAAAAVSFAYGALGSPYVWGASGPHAFDCSGLTQAAYRAAGVALPRTTYAQINAGQRVSRSQLQPGDLVFFYSGISHVGLYVGNGQMIHAPNPSAPVRLAPVDQMPFAGATRVA
ncbi:NlpC/P60 family protein [Streptomyces sp. NPDC091292]|uniref:C40 family peptidase n=1 Tax=Streptomyces sp. NPDC091292 TaxID=3365991 RepID=UPI00382382B1